MTKTAYVCHCKKPNPALDWFGERCTRCGGYVGKSVTLEIDNFPLSEYKKFKLSKVNKPEWSRYILNWRIGNFQIKVLKIFKGKL